VGTVHARRLDRQRSSGQQSYHYGASKIYLRRAHGNARGPIDLPPLPASAAGPDLRHFLLVPKVVWIITRAIVRVQRVPEAEDFHAIFFHDWARAQAPCARSRSGHSGFDAALKQRQETEVTLALSGKDQLVGLAERACGC